MNSIFEVKRGIEHFGVWYALHEHGFRSLWTIWCAARMIKRDRDAQREHAE